MKASRLEIEQQLNLYIGSLKIEGLSEEAKVSLVNLKIELSKIVNEINAYRLEVLNTIDKPENFDKYRELANKPDATEEDKANWRKVEEEYNNRFVEVALPYFKEEVDIPFEPISKEDFYTIVKNNDVNIVYGYEYIYNKLVRV